MPLVTDLAAAWWDTLVHTQIPIVDVLRLVVTQVIDYAGGRWKPWKPFEAQESIARQYETGITRFESWPPIMPMIKGWSKIGISASSAGHKLQPDRKAKRRRAG